MKTLAKKNRCTASNWSKIRLALLINLLMFLSVSLVFAAEYLQDGSPFRTRADVSCIQMPDHQLIVQGRIRARIEGQYQAVPNVALELYNQTDSTSILLGVDTTDARGYVELILNARDQLSIREDGYYTITVSYRGDEKYRSSDDELTFIPAYLDLATTIDDSIKKITVSIIKENENPASTEDLEISLQVPRMFSDLPIASDITDEEGIVEFEFPNDLPGGKNGELKIIAKIEDTDEYASLQSYVETDWGLPTASFHQETRALWSPDAPLWMVGTFTFFMILVWGHFFIVLYKLYLIRKEGKIMDNLENI